MNRADAITSLQRTADAVRGMGATALYLYGSTARDEANAGSDIDLFLDYDPESRFNAFDLIGIKLLLEEHLHVPVDLTTRDGLHPAFAGTHRTLGDTYLLMAREFRHALDDMQDAIHGIQTAVSGKTLADYRSDWLLKHAVQRGIEIISEASRALPDAV